MKRSWWKVTLALLCILILLIGMSLLWSTLNIRNQVRQTVEQTNAHALKLWAGNVQNRLDALYEHLYDLLVSLYNSTELRTGTPIMDVSTKQKIIEMMNDKLMISTDADAFFVLDTENDFYLFSASSTLSNQDIFHLKMQCRTAALDAPLSLREQSWKILEVGDISYFYKNIQLGKYIAGVACRLSRFSPEKTVAILGQDPTFFLALPDQNLTWLGEPDWTENPGRCTVRQRIYNLDGEIVLSAVPALAEQSIAQPVLLFLITALCLALVVLLLLLLRRLVAAPTRTLIEANEMLAAGNIRYRLDEDKARSKEFDALFDSFNNMARQIGNLKIEAYDLRLREQSNRLTMLRAQIRPHSFLNAVTTISNMTYTCRPEEIRAYIQVFAKYIRYMLNVSDPWITVEAEVGHIRNYLKMQDARFPRAIRFTAEYNAAAGECKIPFLLLYTLVENSIKHAMSLYETLDITVRCVREDRDDFHGFCLTEEDSGQGFPEDVAEKLRSGDEPFVKEHLGLSNVRYTLNLTYHRDDLLRLSNRPQGGARVELWIPDKEDNHETSDL